MNFNIVFLIMVTFFHPAFGQVTFSDEGKPQVVYVYDPLCGWCYGFSPVMVRLAEKYKQQADFRVISGGMVRGDRVGPLSDIAPYIRKAYKDVEKLSGVKFGEKYLEILFGQADWIMNSEPPSLIHALLVSEFPDRQTEVSGMIQRGIYQQALAPGSDELAIWVGEQFGKSPEWIRSNLKTTSTIELMNSQFDLSKQLGVTGFPAVLIWNKGQWFMVARGFTDYVSLEQTVQKVLVGE
jgi:putative protein-disulfide isomerase